MEIFEATGQRKTPQIRKRGQKNEFKLCKRDREVDAERQTGC